MPAPANPVERAVRALDGEYEDHLSRQDIRFIVRTVLGSLREPDEPTIKLFLQELDGEAGQHPDPAASGDHRSDLTRERRLALTYAWRRAIDRLAHAVD